MSEVEDTLKKIMSYPGVVGVMVMSNDGIAIRSSLSDQLQTLNYAANMQQVVQKTINCVKELDNSNYPTFIRLRTKKHEIMIAPDKEFFLLVIQVPCVN